MRKPVTGALFVYLLISLALLFTPALLFAQAQLVCPVAQSPCPTIQPLIIYPPSGSATVTVTVGVTDPSGVSVFNGTFTSPSSMQKQSVSLSLSSGSSSNGTWTGMTTFPSNAETGVWTLSLDLLDAGGHPLWDCPALVQLGFSCTLYVNPPFDTTPPVLTSLSFNKNTVDVSNGSASVTLTLGVTDDLSGAQSVWGYFYSPSNGQAQGFGAYLSSGTNLNGTWTGTVTFPQYSEAGTWTLSYICLEDRDTNYQCIHTPDLQKLGFPTTITVVSNQDTTPPTLVNFTLNTTPIDVSAGSKTIAFSLDATDNLSGLQFYCCSVSLSSPSGRQYRYRSPAFAGNPATLPTLSGHWQGEITMPQYSEAGTWNVSSVYLSDADGNTRYYGTQQLQNAGFATAIQVASSPSDTTPPQLPQLANSLVFSPNFIDTTKGDQSVTVTVTLTDNLSGVSYAGLSFLSPSGNQSHYAYFGPYNRIAGTALNGTYQTTVTIPQYSEAGNWQISYVYAVDQVGNYMSLNTAQLQAMGFPTQLVVVLLSNQVDGNVGSSGGSVSDQVFGPRAQVTFPPGVLTQTTHVSIDVFTQQIQLPIPQGYAVAVTNYVNLSLNPEPNTPLPAPGMTLTLPLPNQMAPGSSLTLFKVDPNTGNLIPEPSVYSGNVIGTVNSDGLSATFTGVAGLSVVVGLVPSSVLPGDVNGDGKVDCADMEIVQLAFGKRLGQAGYDSRADTNRDNVVNVYDLAYVSRHLPKGLTCKFQPQAPSVKP